MGISGSGNRRVHGSDAERLSFEKLEDRRLLAGDTIENEIFSDSEVSSSFTEVGFLHSSQMGNSIDHATRISADALAIILEVPANLPDSFALEMELGGKTYTLELIKHSIRSENFRVLVEGEDGTLTEIDAGPESTYRGRVAEDPDLIVGAVIAEGAIHATIANDLTGQVLWEVKPAVNGEAGRHVVSQPEANSYDYGDDAIFLHDHDGNGVSDHSPEDHCVSAGGGHGPGCSCPACCSQGSLPEDTLTDAGLQVGSTVEATRANVRSSTGTADSDIVPAGSGNATLLNPVSVKQAEIAFDVSYHAYVNRYGSSTTTVLDQINLLLSATIGNRLNTIWIRDALVEHHLGTVIIRTSSAQDPYIQQGLGGASGTDSALLNAFRNHWNSGAHGNTHDLAHLMLGAGGGGLAWVGTVGDSFRYSMADGGSKDAWLGFARHEIGHTWGLNHSHGGVEFFQPDSSGEPNGDRYGIMWGPLHGALTPLEQISVVNEANSASGSLDDIGAYPTTTNIRPYAKLDTITIPSSGTYVLDVLANDHDANNDPLYISGVGDRYTTSFTYASGSTLIIGNGLGSQGQDVVLYTPGPGVSSETIFYRVNDGQLDNFGQVNITVTNPSNLTSYGAFQFDFGENLNGPYIGADAPAFLESSNTVWNAVTLNDTDLYTVFNSTGTASGVSLKVRESTDGGVFDFSVPETGLEDRTANYTGFYGTELMTDLVFTRDGDDLGLQVEGLASGEYTIYAILRETAADGPSRTYSIDIGVGTGTTAQHGNFGLGNVTDSPSSAPTSWVQNQNFYTETVNVENGESVFVLIDSLNSDFVSLQGLQVVRTSPIQPLRYEVDAVTGHSWIHNTSTSPVEIDGYAIQSSTDSLRANTWESLSDQGTDGGSWVEFLASAGVLSEVSATGSITIVPGEKVWLGPAFDVNQPQAVEFEYTSSANGTTIIQVPVEFDVYHDPADFNFDGSIDTIDLLTWEESYGVNGGADADSNGLSNGLDFLAWQRSFGQGVVSTSQPASTLTSDSVATVEKDPAEIGHDRRLESTADQVFLGSDKLVSEVLVTKHTLDDAVGPVPDLEKSKTIIPQVSQVTANQTTFYFHLPENKTPPKLRTEVVDYLFGLENTKKYFHLLPAGSFQKAFVAKSGSVFNFEYLEASLDAETDHDVEFGELFAYAENWWKRIK